ncbi:TRAF-like family protein [Euphorbia peplus]|nr:TRAF-like family protein [Euphorbia peplus]
MIFKETVTAARIIKPKIKRSKRYTLPAHYLLKLKSFSQLSEIVKETEDGKYESDEFEVADYKWKLVVYPNGNLKSNGEGHISLYLASTDKKAISSGCHVNILVTFFIYDHIRDNYLTIQDGKIKRYHVLRTRHGFDQLLPSAKFNDPSNGYVIDDCCVFGAEVHVIKNTVKANEFSLIKNPPTGTLTWKIDKFSTLENEKYYSETFSAGGCEWNLKLLPKGDSSEKDCMALYLLLHANNATSQSLVYAEFNLSITDQVMGDHHISREAAHWFEKLTGFGYSSFVELKELRNASKGFLVNDTLIIEAKITRVSVSQDLIS